MTALFSYLSFNIRITGIEGNSFYSRTRQNIKKNISNIVYLEQPPVDAIKLSYAGSSQLSPERDLYIGDRSDTLYDNSKTNSIKEFTSETSPITVKTRNFLVTQVFNYADSGDIPLYYKHIIDETFGNIVPESIKVYDKNFNPVSIDKYKLEAIYEYDEDTGEETSTGLRYELYNNLESSYDYISGEYEVYFLQYIDNSGSVDIVKTLLLDNQPAYSLATEADIWPLTLSLKPWSKTYTYDETTSVITMSQSLFTAVRYEETKRVRVYPPTETEDTFPWYMRVINGNFKSGYGIYSISYKIPEFSNQAFNPIEPYKLAARSESRMIDKHLIKLPNDNIQSGALFSYLYITIEDDNNNVLYAITNNELIDNTDYINFDGNRVYNSDNEIIKWSTSLLSGIDKRSGIVHLDINLLTTYKIYSTYSYKEDFYKIISLNMNPIFDSNATKEVRVFYLVPSNCPTNPAPSGQTEAIRWLRVSSSGKIIQTNQNAYGGNENLDYNVSLIDSSGYGLKGIIGLYYSWYSYTSSSSLQEIYPDNTINVVSTEGFPKSGWLRFVDSISSTIKYAFYREKTNTSFILGSNSNQVPVVSGGVFVASGTTIELVNFINERSTLSNRDYETEIITLSSELTAPVSASRYFILAETSINPPHKIDDTVLIDIRENGGGIKEDKYEDAKKINPRAQWIADYNNYDGQVLPGNAALVVKLPISIKNSFSPEQIKSIVEENITLGVVPLIRYYGYQPEIISVLPSMTDQSIEVQWKKMGEEFTYNVYYSKLKKGPWIKHNIVRLTDSILDIWTGDNIHASAPYEYRDYNIYNITGLDYNTKYFIKITCEDKYYQWWYSYTDPYSIDGGFGSLYNRPSPSEGNLLSFQVEVI
jgi:hypothetical protein